MLGWNWQDDPSNLPIFIKNTLSLLGIYESETSSLFGIPNRQCQTCMKIQTLPGQLVHQINTSKILLDNMVIDLKCLTDMWMEQNGYDKCCTTNMFLKDSSTKCLLMEFSHSISIDLNKEEVFNGQRLKINSFVSEDVMDGARSYFSNFYLKDQAYYQNAEGNICKTDSRNQKIKMLSIFVSKKEDNSSILNVEAFKYDYKVIKQLDRKSEANLNPDKFAQTCHSKKEYEMKRTNDEDRKR